MTGTCLHFENLTLGYSDALSGEDGPASTYLDMFRYNVETLRAAIVGS